ncbi:hypothetical protein BJ875DRAFT_139348 [Amylocarpus encephaloides]|uniref:Thiolase-like protein type 1 additional C-terminal domain-containing protein n=1 Tax=Amylocarpus encephaloides TaxID=45428 RepID=A0A9P7YBR4_9HELO|nr:hypothetical protein BJ875DRAFT_139348 [Amylocarpus encephaloides]
MASRAQPIVVGVADIKNRSQKVEDAIEPAQLMVQAVLEAITDTGLSKPKAKELREAIDSVSVVATWTWNYSDLPGLLAEKIGARPGYRTQSEHGGNSPAKLFDEAARRISSRESNVAVVAGGEALASLAACITAGKMPPPGWTVPDQGGKTVSVSDVSTMGENIGTTHSIGLPIHVYPLYENAFRAHRGQTIKQNNEESAELYGRFAKVAEQNPFAWNYGEPAVESHTIGTVSKKNRMICFPYPLLMNAFNNINLAGACILTSTEYATELGISENRWIYPLGGAGTSDSDKFWERPNFYSSPSISSSLDAGLKVSGLKKEEIDIFDFYSCFPIVPKLACQHLGLPTTKYEKPITLLGGLTSFGGAGNNYSMHALTAMVRELRKGNARNGLVLANGGVATYQHVVCLSNHPRRSPYPMQNILAKILRETPVPNVDERVEGPATIETYTVDFGRDGKPKRGFIIGRLTENNHRFVANEGDVKTLAQLASETREPIGRKGWVTRSEDGRNLFRFEGSEKL